MTTVLVTLVLVVGILYVGALALAGYVAVHPPRSPVFFSPGAMGFVSETFDFAGPEGIRMRATWTAHPDERGVIVVVHGYCMNRSELAVFTPLFRAHGLSCLFVDLRNHGGSGRGRCGIGWYERADVEAAAAEARRRSPGKPLVLMGSSMGAAAVAFAAGERPELADAIVLDSAYDSLHDAADGWWHFLGKATFAPRLWRAAFWPLVRVARPFLGFSPRTASTSRIIAGYRGPALLLHGRADTIAPPAHAERILAALVGPKEIAWFDHCDHAEMRWLQPEAYARAVGAFFDTIGLPAIEAPTSRYDEAKPRGEAPRG